MKTWLLIWCAAYYSSHGDTGCLDTKYNVYDSSAQAMVAFDKIDQHYKNSAILFGGNRYDIYMNYQVKLST